MTDEDVGHATPLNNMLGAGGSSTFACTTSWAINEREHIDFSQKLARFGESVYGFLYHLEARQLGQLLLQSTLTEARQQMIFRQFGSLFSVPVWFEVGIPQTYAWTEGFKIIRVRASDENLEHVKQYTQNFVGAHRDPVKKIASLIAICGIRL